MARLIYDTSMSLDGFITGPDPGPGQPLGTGGDELHEWMAGIADFRYRLEEPAESANEDARVRDELHRRTGAILIGRAMFEVGEEPWGPDPPFAMPVFILTHREQDAISKQGGTTYIFVTEGIDAALKQAQAAAGGKDVLLVGGANIARQFLEAGLLDEIQVHVVPILLGGGVRLFEGTAQLALELRQSLGSSKVTHLTYHVGS